MKHQLEKQINALSNKVIELHTSLFYFTLDFRHNGQYEDYYKQINLNSLDANSKGLLTIKNELELTKNRIFGDTSK